MHWLDWPSTSSRTVTLVFGSKVPSPTYCRSPLELRFTGSRNRAASGRSAFSCTSSSCIAVYRLSGAGLPLSAISILLLISAAHRGHADQTARLQRSGDQRVVRVAQPPEARRVVEVAGGEQVEPVADRARVIADRRGRARSGDHECGNAAAARQLRLVEGGGGVA